MRSPPGTPLVLGPTRIAPGARTVERGSAGGRDRVVGGRIAPQGSQNTQLSLGPKIAPRFWPRGDGPKRSQSLSWCSP